MYYVIDTHALVWYLTDSLSLSRKAREIIRKLPRIKDNLELHDRVIAATAKLYKAKIITRDRKIKKILSSKVIW